MPPEGFKRPVSILNNVVFPAPLWPIIAMSSSLLIVKFNGFTAGMGLLGYFFHKPSNFNPPMISLPLFFLLISKEFTFFFLHPQYSLVNINHIGLVLPLFPLITLSKTQVRRANTKKSIPNHIKA